MSRSGSRTRRTDGKKTDNRMMKNRKKHRMSGKRKRMQVKNSAKCRLLEKKVFTA